MKEKLESPKKIVFFTDALSVLQTLLASKDTELNQLSTSISELASTNNITLQWVPSHCDLYGNEQADSLTKAGSTKMQTDRTTSYREEVTIIKTQQQFRWYAKHTESDKADPYYRFNKKEQVTIFRLTTGHNRLRSHLFLFNKFRIGDTDLCPCLTDYQTVEHVLQSCPLQEELRQKYWPGPTPVSVSRKLSGSLEDLRTTTAFIEDSSLVI